MFPLPPLKFRAAGFPQYGVCPKPALTNASLLDSPKYFAARIVKQGMNTVSAPVGTSYASGYAKGRHAAKERIPVMDNPFRRGTPAYHGWIDGHYDEQSARCLAIARHSAALWSQN